MTAPGSRPPKVLLVHALPHRDAQVRQVGFPLDHPYVEQCWVAAIGPSAALVLRRLPTLWVEAQPAEIDVGEFAHSLGLGRSTGGWKSRIWRAFDRLRSFRLATAVEGGAVGVYAQLPPVSEWKLERLPALTRAAHERLLGEHLERLAEEHRVELAHQVVARLDRLQNPDHGQAGSVPGRSL